MNGDFDALHGYGGYEDIPTVGCGVSVPSCNNWLQNCPGSRLSVRGQVASTSYLSDGTMFVVGNMWLSIFALWEVTSLESHRTEISLSSLFETMDFELGSEPLCSLIVASDDTDKTVIGGRFRSTIPDGSIASNILIWDSVRQKSSTVRLDEAVNAQSSKEESILVRGSFGTHLHIGGSFTDALRGTYIRDFLSL